MHPVSPLPDHIGDLENHEKFMFVLATKILGGSVICYLKQKSVIEEKINSAF